MKISISPGNKISIDRDDHDKIMEHSCYCTDDGYTIITIDGVKIRLSHYLVGAPDDGYIVDHINTIRSDYRKSNLRHITIAMNAQNQLKRENLSSKHKGVYYCKREHKYRAKYATKKLGNFDDEDDAGYVYDCYVLANLGLDARTNFTYDDDEILTILETYEPPKESIKNKYPIGIAKRGNERYRAKYRRKSIGTFNTVEEASQAYQDAKKKHEDFLEKVHMSRKITRNEDGEAVIDIRNRDGDVIRQEIVDERFWYGITRYSWSESNKRRNVYYVCAGINGKTTQLHQFVFYTLMGNEKLKGRKYIVDHIDQNPSNNKSSNLRRATYSMNVQNRKKKEGTSSKYIGVDKQDSGRFLARISHQNKRKTIGYFDTEDEAALAYNKEAVKVGYIPNIIS